MRILNSRFLSPKLRWSTQSRHKRRSVCISQTGNVYSRPVRLARHAQATKDNTHFLTTINTVRMNFSTFPTNHVGTLKQNGRRCYTRRVNSGKHANQLSASRHSTHASASSLVPCPTHPTQNSRRTTRPLTKQLAGITSAKQGAEMLPRLPGVLPKGGHRGGTLSSSARRPAAQAVETLLTRGRGQAGHEQVSRVPLGVIVASRRLRLRRRRLPALHGQKKEPSHRACMDENVFEGVEREKRGQAVEKHRRLTNDGMLGPGMPLTVTRNNI